jgi:translation initiation factor IF-1
MWGFFPIDVVSLSKEDHIEVAGTITAATGGGNFSVLLENGITILAKLSGKMKRFKIKIIPGDKVKVAVSPYDTSHGFVTHRERI